MRDGGPAFPSLGLESLNREGWIVEPCSGMTLRDYFAAAALTGMYLADELARQQVNPGGTRTTAKEYARSAYEQADAMLAAREAAPKPEDDERVNDSESAA